MLLVPLAVNLLHALSSHFLRYRNAKTSDKKDRKEVKSMRDRAESWGISRKYIQWASSIHGFGNNYARKIQALVELKPFNSSHIADNVETSNVLKYEVIH